MSNNESQLLDWVIYWVLFYKCRESGENAKRERKEKIGVLGIYFSFPRRVVVDFVDDQKK